MSRCPASPSPRRTSTLVLLIAVSALLAATGLALGPGWIEDGGALRKPITGALFISICILGMAAVLRPAACSATIGLRLRASAAVSTVESTKVNGPGLRGHHPDCERFSSHVLRIGGRTICAGCTGLFVGGFLALPLAVAFFLGGMGSYSGPLPILAGVAGVSFGLIQFAITSPLAWIRLLASASFAVGSFLVLAAVDEARQSLYADLLVLCIVLYWIMGKIVLSRLSHRRICSLCPDTLCELRPADVSR